MDAPRRVLVVEDDPENLLLFQTWLLQAGFLVLPAPRARTALDWLGQADKPDLAVLDRNLPDMDGLELCRAIKRDPETRRMPVMILTARTDNAGRIEASSGDADLYLNKPVTEGDFLEGVQALLARAGGYLQRRGPLRRGRFELEPELHTVRCEGKPAQVLSPKLFDLLYVLAENHPRVLSRRFILRRLGVGGRDREVDVLVSLLRAKLRRLFGSRLIETVAGRGYRLALPD